MIKFILEGALQNLRLPITWTNFRDMQVKAEFKHLNMTKAPILVRGMKKQRENMKRKQRRKKVKKNKRKMKKKQKKRHMSRGRN